MFRGGIQAELRQQFSVNTYQCCGSGMFIPASGSEFFPSRIPYPNFFSIPDPGSVLKNLNILTLGNMIRVVHSGS